MRTLSGSATGLIAGVSYIPSPFFNAFNMSSGFEKAFKVDGLRSIDNPVYLS